MSTKAMSRTYKTISISKETSKYKYTQVETHLRSNNKERKSKEVKSKQLGYTCRNAKPARDVAPLNRATRASHAY